MTLLSYLRENLVRLMKRREKVALRAVRDAISAIQNAETSYVASPAADTGSEHLAGAVPFGHAERVVAELTDAQMMELARAQVTRRLDESARYRALGDVDRALMLKAEALSLSDHLDAYAG
ncbi:MAG TPA: hypothetical protein VLS51_00705 [Propionibacteriaceae bacterium]|nr:hypothetical protein [Propionibacteriaceae bacterium]